jgi:hypothetical protein
LPRSTATAAPSDPTPLPATSHYFGDLGLFCSRNSWKSDATVATVKCGPWGGFKIAKQGITMRSETSVGHSNPDVMSIFYCCRGEEIIADADYEMRCRTSSHNTIMVEDAGQHGDGIMWPLIYDKWPSIVEVREEADLRYAACDGTDAYPYETMLRSARRHFIQTGEVLVLVDELESFFANWFRVLFNTYGEVALDSRGAALRCGAVDVRLDVVAPADVARIEVSDRMVIARQGYGHETVEEARGRRITVGLVERQKKVTFLTVLRPVDVEVVATLVEGRRVVVEVDGVRREVVLSDRPGLKPR